jgi:serine/threonine protein phosphatase PrpC
MTPIASVPASLRAGGATDVGRRRQVNEDRFHVDLPRGIFIVVDGMGGHAAGDKAADTAIGAMTERLERQTGTIPDRLREAITIANNEVHRLAASRPDWTGMACVTTAVVVDGDRAFVGHVGDSRLYRLVDGRLEKMTPDHSPVGEREDADEMSELEAMRHPRRNEVYRDVGSEPHDAADPGFVYVAELDLPPGGALLLCSDGLTDLVPSETIRRIAIGHAGAPDRVVHALIAAANEAGGKDNITAVYVERAATPIRAVAADGGDAGSPLRATSRGRVVAGMVLAALAGLAAGLIIAGQGWGWPRVTGMAGVWPAGVVVVRPDESIMTALAGALPGTTVLVEPGEYRERLTLRDGIRVLSRVPRGATIRLPSGAAESDAGVVAAGVADAELSGFRIVGDAASPLGVGIITRDAAVRLVDLEISGAVTSAVDLGSGDGLVLSGSHIHDNPGAGLMVRMGATPRITHNTFAKNATSDALSTALIIETGAAPEWSENVFTGMTLQDIAGLAAPIRTSLSEKNLLVASPQAPTPTGRRGRGGP